MCGIFGIVSTKVDIGPYGYFALMALQHRGQESSGMVSFTKDLPFAQYVHKGKGLVNEVFRPLDITHLSNNILVGHNRYTTQGGNDNKDNIQPIVSRTNRGNFAVVHNGNLLNANDDDDDELSDTHYIADLIKDKMDKSYEVTFKEAIGQTAKKLQGGFAFLVATSNALYAVRDPKGNRPLVIGKLKETNEYVFSSESCALDTIGATTIRSVEPGELIEIDINSHYKSTFYVGEDIHKTCIFEYIYFSRPDSVVNDISLYTYRQKLGQRLANLDFLLPTDDTIVTGVPDSGTPAAIGYATQSGISYTKGLVKNKYINRTFIEPTQEMRNKKAILKYNLIPNVVKDKRVVLVDDSIVRGTTMMQLINYLRSKGALEVHVRISSPPIRWECLYGIDTSDKELVAKYRTANEVRDLLGADSLMYLSQADIVKNIGYVDNFCMACFNGDYEI